MLDAPEQHVRLVEETQDKDTGLCSCGAIYASILSWKGHYNTATGQEPGPDQ